jgi:putative ABC transport system permease protein
MGMNMWRLAIQTLRFRRSGFLATFVALFFGTAVVMACGGLMETGIRNNVPAARLAGAAAVVIGDRSYELHPGSPDDSEQEVLPEIAPLDAGLTGKLAAVPGVERVVGDVTFPAVLLAGSSPGAKASAHGWDSAPLAPYGLRSGAPPAGPGQVVLDTATASKAGAGVGDRIRVAAHGGSAVYRVSGIVGGMAGQDRARAVVGPVLFFAQDEARRLAGHPDTYDSLAVVARPGTDGARLTDGITGALAGTHAKVLTGDDRGFAEFPVAQERRSDLISLAGVFGGLAVLVAVFVTAGTVTLSAAQRRRELALMRAIGVTPRQLRRMLLAESLFVAVVAILPAWLPGQWLGGVLFDRLAASGVTSGAVEFTLGRIPLAAAGGAVLLTAVGSGLIGARRAARTRPAEALSEAAVQERWFGVWRLLFALLFLSGAAALVVVTWTVMRGPVASSTAMPAVMLAVIGLALLAPGLTKMCVALLHGPVRALTGASGHLAMLNSRARAVQMGATVAPVMLAVGIATASLYIQTTQDELTNGAFVANLSADAVLTSVSGTVDPALVDRVQELPGVAAASAYVTSLGYLERPDGRGTETGEDGMPLRGVSARGAAGTTAAAATRGSFAALTGRTVALPEGAGHDVGDTVTLRLGDNTTVAVRVVATYRPKASSDAALLPAALLAPHTTAGLPGQILVRAKPGADLGPALAGLAAAEPGLTVEGRDALVAAHDQGTQTQSWVTYLLVGMIIAYTAISVVNSLALATGNRRREFGLQRLTGATRGQVMRMVTVEGLLVGVVGVLLGTAAAAAILVAFVHAAGDGTRLLPSGPGWLYGVVVAAALGLTLSATLVPTWRALRGRPAEAAGAGAE